MADDRKSMAEHNARRVAEWLTNGGTAFEQEGIPESQLGSAVGLSEKELAEAVDYLENRDEVVRFPNSLLKPGRAWPELKASNGGRGGTQPSAPEIRA